MSSPPVTFSQPGQRSVASPHQPAPWLISAGLHLALAAAFLWGVRPAPRPAEPAERVVWEMAVQPAQPIQPEALAMAEMTEPTDAEAEAEPTPEPEPPLEAVPPAETTAPAPPVRDLPPRAPLRTRRTARLRPSAASTRPLAETGTGAAATLPVTAPATLAAQAAAPVIPSSYLARLLGALERYKTYPADARWRRAEGQAMLRFRLRRDGSVASYRIDRSAGDAALDAAVVSMIERAQPLPPLPADMPGDSVELVVPVRFALR